MDLTSQQIKAIHMAYARHSSVRLAAEEAGVPYRDAYVECRLKPQGINSWTDYTKIFLERHGYKTMVEYNHARFARRGDKSRHGKLSRILQDTLKKVGKRKGAWLAREVGTSKQVIHNYIHRKAFPKDRALREKLERTLQLEPGSLERLLEEDRK